MDDLALQEQKKYETLWKSYPIYREQSPADIFTPMFLDCFKKEIKKEDTVIDFGCGTGKSTIDLLKAELNVILVDFCDNCLDSEIFVKMLRFPESISFVPACLWNLPSSLSQADWIICFDVLEHLPEEKVDASLQAMASRMKKGGLLSICLREDHHGSLIGEKLHLTVKPAPWWEKRMSRHFSLHKELLQDEKLLLWAVSPIQAKGV